eukprot:9540200-Lingulodinium_polyedra.AAC.1
MAPAPGARRGGTRATCCLCHLPMRWRSGRPCTGPSCARRQRGPAGRAPRQLAPPNAGPTSPSRS